MPLSTADRDLVDAYCASRRLERGAEIYQVLCRVRGNTVTLVLDEPGFHGVPGERVQMAVARIKHDPGLGSWSLYWFDRHERAHLYEDLAPQGRLDAVLAEIERDPTGIFWG